MTTTIDPSLSVRGKIIAALKADAQLTAIVPSTRIYPSKTPANPTFPFIRVPMMMGTPDEYDGGSGSQQTGVIHNFTKLASTVPDPEAQAATINAHVVRILSGIDAVSLSDGDVMGIHVTLTQVIPDPTEYDVAHGMVSVAALAT